MTLTRWSAALGVATIVLAAASPVPGQCPPPSWASMNQLPGLDGIVHAATTWDPDGAGPAPPVLVVGGLFSFAGGVAANRIAMWDGAFWQPLGTGMDAGVGALAVYNSELIAGGQFTTAGGVPASAIARWNGSTWQPLGGGLASIPPPFAFVPWVGALTVYNGELIVGGNFFAAGGVTASCVARWNGAIWQAMGSGTDNSVTSLTVFNGELVAGGLFTTAGGVPCNHVARWNGSSWQALGAGMSSSPYPTSVDALTVYNAELVAGGYFTNVSGVLTNHIARWNGSTWQTLGTTGMNDSVAALTVYNGELVAAGNFTTAGATTASRVARWNGSTWQSLGTGLESNGAFPAFARAVTVYNGALIAGGYFTTAGGVASNDLARWSGSAWQPFGTGMNGSVYALSVDDGELVAGGTFTAIGGLAASRIARWNGSSWQALGAGMNNGVTALTIYNGDVVAGGHFSYANGVQVNYVARWNGSSWAPLGTGIGGMVGSATYALTEYNGELIAGGLFSTAGTGSASHIARWNGSTWQPLGTWVNGYTGMNSYVYALTVYNGELIAGGQFSTAGGVPANGIARWNGASWQPLGSGMNSVVFSLTVYNGQLIAGGGFTTAGGVPASRIAAWNGSVWQPLGTGINSETDSLTVHDGELIAGGLFTTAGGVPANSIARWNGSSWQPMGTGMGGPSVFHVNTLTPFRGALFAGGSFSTAGGIVSPSLARWSSPLPLLAVAQPSGAGTGVQVSNRWLIPGHEYYDLVSLDLCAGGPGTGPYGGLCFVDPSQLLAQLTLPIGSVPFHFVATAPDATFGPYALPAGLVFEAISVDVTGGVVGCVSPVTAYTVF
jgi:trimeric autotransporter adhesin